MPHLFLRAMVWLSSFFFLAKQHAKSRDMTITRSLLFSLERPHPTHEERVLCCLGLISDTLKRIVFILIHLILTDSNSFLPHKEGGKGISKEISAPIFPITPSTRFHYAEPLIRSFPQRGRKKGYCLGSSWGGLGVVDVFSVEASLERLKAYRDEWKG